MNHTHPLIKLADVQLPSLPSFWPLGWGWWLLIFLLLLTGAILLWRSTQKKRQQQAKQQALTILGELEKKSSLQQTDLQQAMTITKRFAMSYFGRDTCAQLNGHAWYLWLDLHAHQANFVSQSDFWQRILYQPQADLALKEPQSEHAPHLHQAHLEQGLNDLITWVKRCDISAPLNSQASMGDKK